MFLVWSLLKDSFFPSELSSSLKDQKPLLKAQWFRVRNPFETLAASA